jgi:hypothetical protein
VVPADTQELEVRHSNERYCQKGDRVRTPDENPLRHHAHMFDITLSANPYTADELEVSRAVCASCRSPVSETEGQHTYAPVLRAFVVWLYNRWTTAGPDDPLVPSPPPCAAGRGSPHVGTRGLRRSRRRQMP